MTLDYRLDGPDAADVLVLANSLGTTQELWTRQLPALTKRFRVLTYEHPGHGRSPLPEQPATVEAFTLDLLDLLDELDLDRVSFCGVSLGRVVLSCTSAYLGPPEGWHDRAHVVRAEGMDAIADTVVGRWFTTQASDDEPELVGRFRSILVSTPPEGYARCCEAIADWDARERIADIAAPVLVVAGADDPATPLEHAELIASRIPGARLRVLERAAHLANVERAEAFTEAVLEHLGQEVPA